MSRGWSSSNTPWATARLTDSSFQAASGAAIGGEQGKGGVDSREWAAQGDALRETQERKVAHAQLLCHQAASPSTCTPPSTSCLLPLKIKW